MNARERIRSAIHGLPTDRPAAAPYIGNFAIRAAGKSLSDCCTNAAAMTEAQLKAWELFQQDVIVVQSDTYYMAEAFGAPVEYQKNGLPVPQQPIIRKPEDAFKLKPADPLRDGRMAVYIESIARIRETVNDQAAIRGCGTGPFVVAGHLCGIEQLLLWLADTESGEHDYREPLHAIFSTALETLIGFAAEQLNAGADIIQLADSLASLNVISPPMYRKYVYPYEKEFFTRIKPLCQEYGAASLLHICGNNTRVFEEFVQTGADILAIDHAADLAEAIRIIDDRAAVIGNINPSGNLLLGTPAAVRQEAETCLAIGLPGRYLLGTGCEVSVNTPSANIQAILEAARSYRMPDPKRNGTSSAQRNPQPEPSSEVTE